MALSYLVDTDRSLVVITGDYADAAEWQRLAVQVMHDGRIKPGFNFVRDLRNGTTPPEPSMVVAMFDVVRRFWPSVKPTRAAIVTATDDSAAMVAQALADIHQLPIEVFTSMEAALDWLSEREPASTTVAQRS